MKNITEIKDKTKQILRWIWDSESLLSYLIFMVIMFLIIKFIFFPTLGFIMKTNLPMAIVESSSMDHSAIKDISKNYMLCGNYMEKNNVRNFEDYWNICGQWYEQNTNITKEKFEKFRMPGGFSKGDLIIIVGKKNIEIGDIIIFEAESRYPIIHRVVGINPIQTKGDHNPAQLQKELNIEENKIIGTAIAKVPYIGWLKLFLFEIFR